MATSSAAAGLAAIYAGTPARDAILYKGIPFTISGTYEKVAGNTNGDYIGLCRVNRDWSVSTIFLANDALTGASDINIGLVSYDGTTFTDVDENCYADAVDIAAGTAFTDRAYTTRDISKCGQYVWQDAGYSTRGDCAEWLVIAIHLQAATTATGTISWRIGIVAPG
jgi:hypothetical protein